ncbi:hypothetical protein C0159_08120 [Moraxella catarrhalis]|nr:hypothetical protein [Moraxella catarrhalis]MPX26373.1 hypothetical protein [Moraxella catarrhalis]MPX31224.1 hypothetical protein [Moraxella catarrhalis]MPX33152.1 hypothetical protein [Moraxella catarrhalis]
MVLPVIIIAFADCVNHFNDGKCHHIVPTFITNHHKIRQNLLKSLSKCKKKRQYKSLSFIFQA